MCSEGLCYRSLSLCHTSCSLHRKASIGHISLCHTFGQGNVTSVLIYLYLQLIRWCVSAGLSGTYITHHLGSGIAGPIQDVNAGPISAIVTLSGQGGYYAGVLKVNF